MGVTLPLKGDRKQVTEVNVFSVEMYICLTLISSFLVFCMWPNCMQVLYLLNVPAFFLLFHFH